MMTNTPQLHPAKFFEMLRWLDGEPMLSVIEPYRMAIFDKALFTFEADGLTPRYNLALCGRGKKNWKSVDLLLAGFYRLLAWKTTGGNDCLIVAFDLEQAGDDLDLAKKIVRVNPVLKKALVVKTNEIQRRDGGGFLRVIPGGDTSGQHGKSFLFLGVDELHSQRDYSLLEGLQLDPHRKDALQWLTSYDTLLRRANVPIYDLMMKGKQGTDRRFFFSWFAGDFCTDPEFGGKATAVERANPSLTFLNGLNDYIEQQRGRLPAHLFRRLHENVGGQPQGAAFAAESVLSSIAAGVTVRPPVAGINYAAAVDMSDGSSDDACLAIGHLDQEQRVIVDLVINQQAKAPFDPLKATKLFSQTVKSYRVAQVTLDRFAHNTFASAFASHGISAVLSELTTHQTYEAFGPRLNSGQIVLLDNADLQNQFLGLQWRGARIDHLPAEHDDYSAAVARLVNVLQVGTLDLSMVSFGKERIMSRGGWDDDRHEGSSIARAYDSGELSRRSKWDW